ncbi:MAG: DUF4349 domain-containing protein [Spirochaetes bacterium]|nr:DUF4349 domain-containing protein [Spirochaetota bacterium]
MNKTIQSGLLITFVFIFFSCASAGRAMAPEASLASFDANETSLSRTRASGNIADSRMVAYTVTLGLSVRDMEETRARLSEQVRKNNGFIIWVTENSVTARIPAKSMDNYLQNARTLGRIDRETKTGTDITDQYRDNVIRLESLRNVRERYLALLERANSVSDILSIERELERVNTEIEIMEGRIRHAELSVAYSHITVRFRERARPGPVGWVFYGLYQGIKWLFVWN